MQLLEKQCWKFKQLWCENHGLFRLEEMRQAGQMYELAKDREAKIKENTFCLHNSNDWVILTIENISFNISDDESQEVLPVHNGKASERESDQKFDKPFYGHSSQMRSWPRTQALLGQKFQSFTDKKLVSHFFTAVQLPPISTADLFLADRHLMIPSSIIPEKERLFEPTSKTDKKLLQTNPFNLFEFQPTSIKEICLEIIEIPENSNDKSLFLLSDRMFLP